MTNYQQLSNCPIGYGTSGPDYLPSALTNYQQLSNCPIGYGTSGPDYLASALTAVLRCCPFVFRSPEWTAFLGYLDNALMGDSWGWVKDMSPSDLYHAAVGYAEAEAE